MKDIFDRPALDAALEEEMRKCDASMKRLSALTSAASTASHDSQAGGDARRRTHGSDVLSRRSSNGDLTAEGEGDCTIVDDSDHVPRVRGSARNRRRMRSSKPKRSSLEHGSTTQTATTTPGMTTGAKELTGASLLSDESDFLGLSPLDLQPRQLTSAAMQDGPPIPRTRSRTFVIYEGRRRLVRSNRTAGSDDVSQATVLAVNARQLPPLKPRDIPDGCKCALNLYRCSVILLEKKGKHASTCSIFVIVSIRIMSPLNALSLR